MSAMFRVTRLDIVSCFDGVFRRRSRVGAVKRPVPIERNSPLGNYNNVPRVQLRNYGRDIDLGFSWSDARTICFRCRFA